MKKEEKQKWEGKKKKVEWPNWAGPLAELPNPGYAARSIRAANGRCLGIPASNLVGREGGTAHLCNVACRGGPAHHRLLPLFAFFNLPLPFLPRTTAGARRPKLPTPGGPSILPLYGSLHFSRRWAPPPALRPAPSPNPKFTG
jgi:hypothetical protein